MQPHDADTVLAWYGVRSLFKVGDGMYEERITLHRSRDLDDALARATEAAHSYANDLTTNDLPVEYLSAFGQAYALDEDPVIDGAEVFSLIRDSDLQPDDYIDRHFDTGTEHQRDD